MDKEPYENMNCTFAFGGSAFTLHQKEGIPMSEAQNIENAYKELHSGVYEYGNNKLKEVINLGYIESTNGFKLHLPYFDEFKKTHEWISTLNRQWWQDYKIGKLEYKEYKKAQEAFEQYNVKNQRCFDLYKNNSYNISKYFQKKGEYFRLSLNNPAQATAAHQTKAATNKIYEYIWKNKHFWDARISLVVHDEIGLEVKKELSLQYKDTLEKSMKNEGNKFLINPLLFMDCEAKINTNWYNAK